MVIVLALVLLMVVLGAPFWPWSKPWGYRPFGGLLLLLVVIVVVLALQGNGGSAGGGITAHGCNLHW